MKEHKCKGLKAALKQVDHLRDCGPYYVPVFQDKWISGAIVGSRLDEDSDKAAKTLGGTLHMWFAEIKFCPFCGFEYREENK